MQSSSVNEINFVTTKVTKSTKVKSY